MKKRSGLYSLTGEDISNLSYLGVYVISNRINNYLYVGSTTRSFYERWIEHYNDLKNNKHHCKHLQNFVNKYGINKLTFSVIEVITNPEDCQIREKFWIDFYGFENCFNTTQETDLYVSGETHPLFKKIDSNKVLELYNEGFRTKELSRFFGVSDSKIKKTLYSVGINHIRRTHDIPMEEVIKKRKQGWKFKDIAKFYDIDRLTLRNRLKNYGEKEF